MTTPYSWAVPGALCACTGDGFMYVARRYALADWPRRGRVYTVRAAWCGCTHCCTDTATPYLHLEELHVGLPQGRTTPCCAPAAETGWGADGFRPVRKPDIGVLTRLLAPRPQQHQLEKTP